ncbi:MAG: hypothetical protein ACRC5T_08160 [Cetobacterium sp.]
MKDLSNVFSPEISPIHKVDFSVATQLTVAGTEGTIKAGTLLAGDVLANPTVGVTVGADGSAKCILMHDVNVEAGVTKYSVGVMVSGVVYKDVVELAIGRPVAVADETALKANGILFYNTKTIKA